MRDASNSGHPVPMHARPEDRYGGVKVGSAFFGWLTATGTTALVTALVSAVGGALGLAMTRDAGQAAREAAQNPQTVETVGLLGAIVLLVILFVAYYCGGYVAGRMARFNGIKQGVAVWVWGLVIALVITLLGAIVGSQFDPLATVNGLPQLPVTVNISTTGGIITALAAAAVSLLGAILGGLAGMRFHRNVDRAGFVS